MDPKPTLSDLLALRDGELNDAGVAAYVEVDDASRTELDRLRRMKSELAALPPVTPDPSVWQAIRERTGDAGSLWLQRFPLATAASVFVAATLTMVLWNPTGNLQPSPGPQASDPVAQLMLQSQRLESELLTRTNAPAVPTTSSEQALVYGIADVDSQLNEIYTSGKSDRGERERLWRQRVMLLESLADIQRSQAVLRPAIY